MSKLVVLGYREDLDRAIKRRGFEPYYLVQASAAAPAGRRFARVADLENAQEISRAVLAGRIGEIAGVLTVHEMGVFGAAYLRQQMGLPGNADSQRVLYFRDKYLQKSMLPDGVRHARCRYLSQDTSYAELVADLGDVLVIKPANGAGSLRTDIVRSAEEYARAVKPLAGRSDVQVVAESFIDAPEIYLDGIWQNGELRWSSLARYNVAPLSAAQGRVLAAHILDEKLNASLIHRARALAGQALTSLNAPDCVFHLEIFVENDGLTFGECAIRLPGGLSPQINKLTFGVDLFDAEISLAVGEEPAGILEDGAPDRLYGFAFLRRPDTGRLTRQDFEDRFLLDEIEYSESPDTPLGPYGKVGHAIVSDRDELKLRERLEEIVRFNEFGCVEKARP